ncbi:MAG: hypothetical protein OHK0048_03630 [Rhodoferax sp.]
MTPSEYCVQRITSEYVESEDRLRLCAEVDAGQRVVLWLTQRLANRLVTALWRWLGRGWPDVARPEVWQEFAQDRARQSLQPQAKVNAEGARANWRVDSVDLTYAEGAVQLRFVGAQSTPVVLSLTELPLRQWLAILESLYRSADWPLSAWPQGSDSYTSANSTPATRVLH